MVDAWGPVHVTLRVGACDPICRSTVYKMQSSTRKKLIVVHQRRLQCIMETTKQVFVMCVGIWL